jgi:membrane protein YdbS with pleckstrin-like domain
MIVKESSTPPAYPVTLTIDYPDRLLNRLTTFFRIFTLIPIAIILALVSGAGLDWGRMHHWDWPFAAGGILFLATLLMILFRQKYPRWWFDWNVALVKFITRVGAYIGLLTDVYPSTDEEQSVHIEIPYPDVLKDLNRWYPLVKWLLAVPHYIVLACLLVAAIVCVVVAWFAILFTGHYPRGLFDFVVGVSRWGLRVAAYAFLLTTDQYPLFSLH